MSSHSFLAGLESLPPEPPFDLWQPALCNNINASIDEAGNWYLQGSLISKPRLVALLARVLVIENGQHYLKTPYEKVAVDVARYPYMITSWRTVQTEQTQHIQVTTNAGHTVIISELHPLQWNAAEPDGKSLSVVIHRDLLAGVARSVYYQWAEIADLYQQENQTLAMIKSGDKHYAIGSAE